MCMKANVFQISWGIVALLSFVVMAVAFVLPYPPVVIGSGAVFFAACVVIGTNYTNHLSNTLDKLSDNGLY